MSTRLIVLLASSLLLAGCATTGGQYSRPHDGGFARCLDCGTVDRIERVYGGGEPTGVGVVTGAVIGGLLGNQVGKGRGRRAATAAGAIGGAVAGQAIERDIRSAPRYELFITMDDGRRIIVEQREIGAIRPGSYVRVRGNSVELIR